VVGQPHAELPVGASHVSGFGVTQALGQVSALFDHGLDLLAIKGGRGGSPAQLSLGGQPHLLHALREFELFYNGHRPHQGIANARPLQPLPVPLVVPDQIASLGIRRHDRLGGVLHEYQHAA
jgi:hypothetical protein